MIKDNFSKKRIAAGAVILNRGKILLVKATYKDHWSFSGGIIKELESPAEGLKREVKEELGLRIKVGKPLIIEYLKRPKENRIEESIQMLFLCKLGKGEKLSNIKFVDGEIEEYKFVLPKMVPKMISKWGAKRWESVMEALKKNKIMYLENKYKK